MMDVLNERIKVQGNFDILPPDFFAPSQSEVLFYEYQCYLERKSILLAEREQSEKTHFYDWQLDWMPELYENYTGHY